MAENSKSDIAEVLRQQLQQQQQPEVQQQQQQQLLPDSADSSKMTTPAMSVVPSSANLLGMDRNKKKQKRRMTNAMHKLKKQLSVNQDNNNRHQVALPMPAMPQIPEKKAVFKKALAAFARIPALMALLFIFICSLDVLSTAFRLLAGKAAGEFANFIIITI